MQVYGADKVWKQMNRESITVARCTGRCCINQAASRDVYAQQAEQFLC